ncbi:universal stress protein [Verrucomicrobium sp. BvORR034]|jgi:nucleotide-binding universal stress UspA family protein|uniref:universal stress protein n=1 Tax=Verrucomicrobium sp. BvORR034 TaxID=1396418 RepID=UPI0006797B14|nr:universal stress protein [Verrucomicrobium sp. BvORR034]
MKTIVALVDFSDLTFKILKQAHKLAHAFGSHVIVVHVVPKEPTVVGIGVASPTVLREPTDEEIATDREKLDSLGESLTKFGVQTTTKQLRGATVESIVAEATHLHADLILMGTHGHGALYNFLVGTATSDVLKKAPCPVLIVPSTAKDA